LVIALGQAENVGESKSPQRHLSKPSTESEKNKCSAVQIGSPPTPTVPRPLTLKRCPRRKEAVTPASPVWFRHSPDGMFGWWRVKTRQTSFFDHITCIHQNHPSLCPHFSLQQDGRHERLTEGRMGPESWHLILPSFSSFLNARSLTERFPCLPLLVVFNLSSAPEARNFLTCHWQTADFSLLLAILRGFKFAFWQTSCELRDP
jgi:hypothetical protein